MYFEEARVRALVLALQAHFPGAELVVDAFSPYIVWANNIRIRLTKMGARYHWALKRSQDLEGWGPGLCLLDEWNFFDSPEPRASHIRWMRHIPLFANTLRIVHYQLGRATSFRRCDLSVQPSRGQRICLSCRPQVDCVIFGRTP